MRALASERLYTCYMQSALAVGHLAILIAQSDCLARLSTNIASISHNFVSRSLFSLSFNYQGISPVGGLFSSLKNIPVGPFLSIKAYFTIRFPASSTVPVPLCPLKSVLV